MKLVSSWGWLNRHGKTPVELADVTWEEIDPWWHDAVARVDQGYARAQKQDLDS